MNEKIMRKAGFAEEVELVKGGICPFCGKRIGKGEFRDGVSLREYRISGLCQKCQDFS